MFFYQLHEKNSSTKSADIRFEQTNDAAAGSSDPNLTSSFVPDHKRLKAHVRDALDSYVGKSCADLCRRRGLLGSSPPGGDAPELFAGEGRVEGAQGPTQAPPGVL